MAGMQTPVVFIPRFTTFVGPFFYHGLPLDVTAFSDANLSVWRGPLVGTAPPAPTFSVQFQQSVDRILWDPIGSAVAPPSNTEAPIAFAITQPWLRYQLVVGGPNSGVTCWLQGFLIRRER